MNVFELLAKLTLDSSEYENGLDGADKKASDFGSKLKSGLGTSVKVAGASLAAVGAGVAAVSKKMANGISETASYGDNIDKMSQKLGMSAEAYQEWDFITQHAGASVDSLQTSMKTLSNAAVDGNDAFEKLGISLEDAQSMSTEDLFASVITQLQGMEAGTERTALASDLLGKSATELGALLNMSAEETAGLKDQAHELGGVLSDEAVKASADYADSMQNLQTAISGISRGALSDFLPAINEVLNGLTAIFSGDDSGVEAISSGINTFVNKITEILPQIMNVGTSIISTLALAIIDNLPAMAESATEVVMNLADLIIQNLPFIIETAGTIIISLANGISDSLPTLIPTIVDVVLTIVENLLDNIDLLIECALNLVIALAEGLINALPKLVEKAPVIISKLVEGLVKSFPKIVEAAGKLIATMIQGIANYYGQVLETGKEIIITIKDGIMEKINDAKTWGKDLIDNFIGGIKEKWESLKSTVSDVAQTVKDFLGFSEPKLGPLSNFHTYAPDMMELFAQGIKDNENLVTNQIARSFDFGSVEQFSNNNGSYYSGDSFNTNQLANALADAIAGLNLVATIDGDDAFDYMRSKAKSYKDKTGKYAFV